MSDIQDIPGRNANRNYLTWLAYLTQKAKNMAYMRNTTNWEPIYNRLVSEYSRYLTLVDNTGEADPIYVVNGGNFVVNSGNRVVNSG